VTYSVVWSEPALARLADEYLAARAMGVGRNSRKPWMAWKLICLAIQRRRVNRDQGRSAPYMTCRQTSFFGLMKWG